MKVPRFVTAFPPISIDYSPRKFQVGEINLLKVSFEIPEGFDIMAHKPSEEFLVPAELILESPEGIIVGDPSYPEAKEEKFDWSEITLRIYKGKFDVDVPIEVAAERSGRLELHGILSFQGCTENQCLPPKKQDFTLSFDVLKTIGTNP